MRIKEISSSMKVKTHDMMMIQVLSYFISNPELKNKVQFTCNIYQELEKNLEQYHSREDQILYNYIDNDEVILSKAISEMKEEVYQYYNTKTLLIFDNLSNQELIEIYEMFQLSNSLHPLSQIIKEEVRMHAKKINEYLASLKEAIDKEVLEREKKFIPLASSQIQSIDEKVSNGFLNQLYQDIKTSLKYLPSQYSENETYLLIKKLYLMILISNHLGE